MLGPILQTVTFGVIAYNEHRYLPGLIEDLLSQTYPKSLIEVIFVDGNSSDDTWQIMERFQKEHSSDYICVKLLKNNKRIQPAGWNVVINNSTADVLLRIDAHARLPEDFVEKSMACINSGEDVCGGPRENIIDDPSPWKKMLLAAEQSMFGSGVASYRHGTEERKYVKSVFHGAYKKKVVDDVGLFNENLIRTEDNEFHYRIRKAGYRICYDPEIHSYYQTRNSLKEMLRQKFQNGVWIGKTLFICPNCISLFHLIPFLFVMAILITTVLWVFGIVWPAATLWVAYGAANLCMTLISIPVLKKQNDYIIVLPAVFFLLHVCYGMGTVFGIVHRR